MGVAPSRSYWGFRGSDRRYSEHVTCMWYLPGGAATQAYDEYPEPDQHHEAELAGREAERLCNASAAYWCCTACSTSR